MRVLSFIPALLLAAAGFVAAAPTPPDTKAVGACAPSGNDFNNAPAEIQPVIAVIAGVTAKIQPLSTQLQGYTANPNPDDVRGVVVAATVILKQAVVDIKAAITVDLATVKLWAAVSVIFELCAAIGVFLGHLVVIINVLGGSVVGALLTAVGELLAAIGALVVELKVFVVGDVSIVLGSIIAALCAEVNLLGAVLKIGVIIAAV